MLSIPAMLHIAMIPATANICKNGKDRRGESRHNVAMAKKSKKAKRAGHYLREWREFREMTQEDLAGKVRPATNASVISLLESGDRGLSNKWLERLAPALGTKKGFILDMNPYETDTAILEIWGLIPEDDRPKVRGIMQAFIRKAS